MARTISRNRRPAAPIYSLLRRSQWQISGNCPHIATARRCAKRSEAKRKPLIYNAATAIRSTVSAGKSRSGRRGRRFESSHPDQIFKDHRNIDPFQLDVVVNAVMAVRRMPCRIDGAFFLPASRHRHRQRQTPDGAGALYEADYSANRRRERIDAKARTSGRDIRGPSLKQPLRSSLPTSQGQIYRAVLDFPPHLRSRNPLPGLTRPLPAGFNGLAHRSLPIFRGA